MTNRYRMTFSLSGMVQTVTLYATLEDAKAAAETAAAGRGIDLPVQWVMTPGGEWYLAYNVLDAPWWVIAEGEPRTRLRTDYRDGERLGGDAQLTWQSVLRIARAIGNWRAAARIAKYEHSPAYMPVIYLCILNQAARRLPVALKSVPLRARQPVTAKRYNAICQDINAILDYPDKEAK